MARMSPVEMESTIKKQNAELAFLTSPRTVAMCAVVSENPGMDTGSFISCMRQSADLRAAAGLSDAAWRGCVATMVVLDGRASREQDEMLAEMGGRQTGDNEAWAAWAAANPSWIGSRRLFTEERRQAFVADAKKKIASCKKGLRDYARQQVVNRTTWAAR